MTKKQQQRHIDLEARQAAWMENKGERLTDDELRELCDFRRMAKEAAGRPKRQRKPVA